MPIPKILVFAGSIRTGSLNARLAALAAKELAIIGADVNRISLVDYPLPIYDGDLEERSGPPENALKLKRMISIHHGVFIASPEYNASIAPLLKNAIDWVSRVREGREPPLAAYKNRYFALGAASNGMHGGMRSLIALRQTLELGCGALVIPEQVVVARAGDAFDEMDGLKDEAAAERMRGALRRLVELSRQIA